MSHSLASRPRTLILVISLVLAFLTTFTGSLSPLSKALPQANAEQRCPAVVVVAARGSGQNYRIDPTSYSPEAPWVSNGWEAETIRAFLRHSEDRYSATHGGTSLMKDVEVLGLEPWYYPATFPAYEIPAVAVPVTLAQSFGLADELVGLVAQAAPRAAREFLDSVQLGRAGVMHAINDYEAATGCHPSYILSGFSQGVMVLLEHERELAARGQLAGVVYFGNPTTAPGDWSTVGVAGGGAGGILGALPLNSRTAAATDNRVNYCLPLDNVCDLSIQSLQGSAGNGGNHGRYFLAPSQWDNEVSDGFGRFVDQVRYR